MSLEGAFRVLLAELASVGLDPAAVLTAARLDPRTLDDAGAPLGLPELNRALQCAEVMADDALLGLHMAERTPGRGVLAYLARAQRTVGEGIAAFARFAGNSWGDAEAVRVEPRGATTRVAFRFAPDVPRHAVDYLLARTAISLRRSGAPPQEVRLRHAAGDASEYQRVLRCPVRFRQKETRIELRSDDLARPLRTANPEAADALAHALARPVAPLSTSVAARLTAAIEQSLARGERLNREALARSLGMSGKTLARRLGAEQRLFRDVVDGVRRGLAQRLVMDPALDLGAVAASVGFADLAAFGKAFRRWFGTSPSAFRARRAGRMRRPAQARRASATR